MSIEVSSADFNDFSQDFDDFFKPTALSIPEFHQAIFSWENGPFFSTKTFVPQEILSELAMKTQSMAREHHRGSGASAEAGISCGWGGKDGIELSGYATGTVHDDKGNSAQVTVEQKSDGTGNVDVSVRHDEQSRKN
ncbi:MAG: hypothetical protein Q8L98_07825 [Chlamydiales bacterium]|nr:hypothetical protein [Chlamydiales bacterium]